MGLDHRDHLGLGHRAGRAQHRGDLHRMVPVVVDHPHAAHHAGGGEAPLDPAKALQAGADGLVGDAQLASDGDGGQGVQHIVPPGHGHAHVIQAHDIPADGRDHHVEAGAVGAHLQVDGPHLGLWVGPVGDDAAVLHPGGHGLHFGMVEAHHGAAVEGDALDEFLEGPFDGLEVAPVVQMLGIDVGDHRHGGLQIEEGAVALVGLDHHPFALAGLGVGAIGVDHPAVHHRGIDTPGVQQRRHQRGGGGLAVGAGDGDRVFQPHQLGQHLGALDQRDAPLLGGHQLGIVRLDGGRIDHRGGALDVGAVLADEDPGPQLLQPLGVGRGLGVGALHHIAQGQHDLGISAHAGAADAGEVDRTDVEGNGRTRTGHLGSIAQRRARASPLGLKRLSRWLRPDRPVSRRRRARRRSARLRPSSPVSPGCPAGAAGRRPGLPGSAGPRR